MSRVSNLSRRSLLLVSALLAALLIGETVVLAATVVKSGGAVRAVKVAVSPGGWSVSAAAVWTTISGMSLTMNVPSGEKALFLITFSAETQCLDGEGSDTLCWVRAVADGQPITPEVVLDSAGDGENTAHETNSVQFVAGPLSAGSHTLKLQALVGGTSSIFGLNERTMSVLRARV